MKSLALKTLTGCLCLALASSACAKKSSDPPGSREGRTLQIAVIPKGTTHEFWKSIHAGALGPRAARDHGAAH